MWAVVDAPTLRMGLRLSFCALFNPSILSSPYAVRIGNFKEQSALLPNHDRPPVNAYARLLPACADYFLLKPLHVE